MAAFRWTIFVFLPLSIIVLLALFAVFGMENRAAVKIAKAPTSADAERARSFAKRAIKQVVDAKQATVLSISEQDLDSSFALMSRAVRRLKGDATITRRGLEAAVTLALPKNLFRSYVNIRIGLGPSTRGLEIPNSLSVRSKFPVGTRRASSVTD